jgi:hypothetical protein
MLYTVYDLVNQSICFRWKQFCLSFRKDSLICIRILYFLLATIHVLPGIAYTGGSGTLI